MKALPSDVTEYSRTARFAESSIPKALLDDHATKAGVWGRIVVESGELLLTFADSGEAIVLKPGEDGIVSPEERHCVQPVGAVAFHVELCR